MIRFRLLLSLAFSLMVYCVAYADNVRISGKVVDSEDKPIEFGTVQVKGTAIGTNTDLEGKYSLSVAENDSPRPAGDTSDQRPTERSYTACRCPLCLSESCPVSLADRRTVRSPPYPCRQRRSSDSGGSHKEYQP